MHNFKEFVYQQHDKESEFIVNAYLNNPKVKISELANYFNISEAEIYRTLHKNNIFPNRLKKYHDKVVNLAHLGWGINEIAKFTGYSTRNIRYIIDSQGQ